MPSPVAHTATGVVFFLIFYKSYIARISSLKKSLLILLLVVLSNFPDFDFLPGFLVGEPNRFHHGITHSAVTAVLAVTMVYWLVKKYFIEFDTIRLYFLLIATLTSHSILDYFTVDTVLPYGVPLFWPLHSEYVLSPYSLFMGISRSGESTTIFIASLFNHYNLISIIGEIFYSLAIISITLLLKYRNTHPYQLQLLISAVLSTAIFISYGIWIDIQAS